jgi:HEPN domain-containing protein
MTEDKVIYWIEITDYDLETAKAMLATGRWLYVGFMCCQVIEKILKAVIAKDDILPPKIHDLGRLAEMGTIYTAMSDEQKTFLEKLQPFQIEARYPESRNKLSKQLNEQVCRELITSTEDMVLWIKSKL